MLNPDMSFNNSRATVGEAPDILITGNSIIYNCQKICY